jgi:hypothetical protein
MSAVLETPRCKLCALEQAFGGRACSLHARVPYQQSAESAFRSGQPERIRKQSGRRGGNWSWKPPRRQRRRKAAP